MTNREKLLHTSEFDLLCRMNNNILNWEHIYDNQCVIEAITGKRYECPDEGFDIKGFETVCDACISLWLNSDYDGRW